ncbi:sterol desaturase family protein [Coralliovum pocilloporae]|uniref:sterol desaturase family protein n=1 Tax=Coralliovum pocilloporae TaxID=3066369 RepID=UPI0033078E6C
MDFPDVIFSVFSDFTNPKKRVFVGYLALSMVIAFLWLVLARREKLSKSWARILDKRVFFSSSAVADYKIFVINRLFSLFISPLLFTQLLIATSLFFILHEQSLVPQGHFAETSKAVVIALFSIAMFVMDDFTKYLAHRWMHRFPILWAIHKVHHSAETLTPVTVYRVHPLEGLLYAMRGTVAQGSVMALFIFLFGNKVDLYTVVGVNVLVFIFHVTGSNLRHSHINISYWPWLEHLFISPAQHQLHHSVAEEHFDKNFGAALAIWDWLFGSLHISDSEQDLTFGLDASERSSGDKLLVLYWQPVKDIGRILTRPWRRLGKRFSEKWFSGEPESSRIGFGTRLHRHYGGAINDDIAPASGPMRSKTPHDPISFD